MQRGNYRRFPLPLYLKLASEEARRWRSFGDLPDILIEVLRAATAAAANAARIHQIGPRASATDPTFGIELHVVGQSLGSPTANQREQNEGADPEGGWFWNRRA